MLAPKAPKRAAAPLCEGSPPGHPDLKGASVRAISLVVGCDSVVTAVCLDKTDVRFTFHHCGLFGHGRTSTHRGRNPKPARCPGDDTGPAHTDAVGSQAPFSSAEPPAPWDTDGLRVCVDLDHFAVPTTGTGPGSAASSARSPPSRVRPRSAWPCPSRPPAGRPEGARN